MKITEKNFVKELKRRNEDALEFVVANYGRLYKAVINRILYEYPEDAEECLYDTVFKIWENIGGYDENVSFNGWSVVIAKHTALNRLKKLKRLEPALNIEEISAADTCGLTGDALFDEVFSELISCLSDKDKLLFIKIFWNGESIDDVSKDMGISKSIAYNRISRGRKRIIKHRPEFFKGGGGR